jgi:sialate O-acetylesterase
MGDGFLIQGVFIKEGISNFQILQQINGFAKVKFSGNYTTILHSKINEVYIRVVKEDSSENVIYWQKCENDSTKQKGDWKTELYIPQGGLYRIETCLYNGNDFEWSLRGDMVFHVGVGDVYVIAGQSNAAGYGKDPAYDPPELGVHILKNNMTWDIATHPLNDSTNTAHKENTEAANSGSSPYLAFAKMLRKELGYPIGLLQTSLGGSVLEAWNPAEKGELYRCMMKVAQSQNNHIKGILWYQGCSDCNEPQCSTYFERFENMVNCVRKETGIEELAFLTVQLNRYADSALNAENDLCWGKIRETQRQAARKLSNVFVVPATDCILTDVIHNNSSSNIKLGERIARLALSEIYGKKINAKAPDLATTKKIGSNKAELVFDNVYGSFNFMGLAASDLTITASDEIGILNVKAYSSEKNRIVLEFTRDMQGKVFVHNAYTCNPSYSIPKDTATGLPMLSFYHIEVE